MSKIAEKKVMELGYGKDPLGRNEYSANDVFEAGVECYDQAVQDFLEKACEWLSKNARNYYSAYATSDKLIDDFKNYMQNESEN